MIEFISAANSSVTLVDIVLVATGWICGRYL